MKKYLSLSLIVLMSAFATACNKPTPPADVPQTDIKTEVVVETETKVEEVAKDYVGLTTEKAQALAETNGVDFRVLRNDGEYLPATLDYRIGRINAEVEKGIVVSYDVEGQDEVTAYDQNSWKTMISPSCQSFFDGCNNCQRVEGSDEAACTRMFCPEYEQPRCLDGEQEGLVEPANQGS